MTSLIKMEVGGARDDATVKECVNVLTENSREEVIPAVDVLIKCVSNILQHPNNPKYRRLKVGSREVTERLLPVKGALECLFIIGFEEGSDYFVLPEHTPLEPMHRLYDLLIKCRSELAQTPSVEESIPTREISDTRVVVNETKLWDIKKYPSHIQVLESRFQRRIESMLHHVTLYEDPTIQHKTKSYIPINELNHNAQRHYEGICKGQVSPDIKAKPMDLRDCLLIELLFWFKNSFFKWFDAPNCPSCNMVMTRTTEQASPLLEEAAWEASDIEIYTCDGCTKKTRFPRYNHPLKLLDTRTGRCGEWANCFTLCARALCFEARFVLDWTDHMWSEVYSVSQKRWLHCDPCENCCDAPLMYEAGWGKKLTYILAVSNEDIQDVTWRYSANHTKVLHRRLLCRESWLLQSILKFRQRLQQGLEPGRRKVLTDRLANELAEFMCPKSAKENEVHGRTSGSQAWRRQRGELGLTSANIQGMTFEISTEEIVNKVFHLKYSTATDKYIRVSTSNTELSGWQAGVCEASNVFRKIEQDWKMAYLARSEGMNTGSMVWKFDCSKTNLKIAAVSVKCSFTTYESGSVVWQMCAGDKCMRIPGGDVVFTTSEMNGTKQLTLSVLLSGGVGDIAWQHAQLFRQSIKDKNLFPFDITIHFE